MRLFSVLASLLYAAQHVSASDRVGDYIAQGLGIWSNSSIAAARPVAEGPVTVGDHVLTATKLSNGKIALANTTIDPSTTPLRTTFASRAASSPIAEDLVTIGGQVVTATKLANGDIAVADTTINTSKTPSRTLSPSFTGTGAAGNASVDECYASWNKYWVAEKEVADYYHSLKSGAAGGRKPTATETSTDVEFYAAVKGTTYTLVTTIQTTIDVVNGGFTISTQTIDTTSSSVVVQTARPGSEQTYLYTKTLYASEAMTGGLPLDIPPKPTCKLPSVVGDCQRSWEAYITTQLMPSPTPPPHCDFKDQFPFTESLPPCAKSHYDAVSSYEKRIGDFRYSTPQCTAASISESLCQNVRDAYQMDRGFRPDIDNATQSRDGAPFFFNQGTIGLYKGFDTTWVWPTSSTLGQAPGCTLGCGRCAVTGGTVELIYWPATATQSINASAATAVATQPPIVTVETLGTTFTSPTLYISYKSLYASNACGTVGTEIGETMLAIPTDRPLSSVYAHTVACDAHFHPTQVNTATAPFTVEDLHGTVPYSIYSSQPWCQTWLRNNGCSGTCPTTAPYKPILVVDNDILRGLQPAWADCWGDIRGVYDPPIALTEAAVAAKPTLVEPVPQKPDPATGPAAEVAAPTRAADHDHDTVPSKQAPSLPKQPTKSAISPSESEEMDAPPRRPDVAPGKSEDESEAPSVDPQQSPTRQNPTQHDPSQHDPVQQSSPEQDLSKQGHGQSEAQGQGATWGTAQGHAQHPPQGPQKGHPHDVGHEDKPLQELGGSLQDPFPGIVRLLQTLAGTTGAEDPNDRTSKSKEDQDNDGQTGQEQRVGPVKPDTMSSPSTSQQSSAMQDLDQDNAAIPDEEGAADTSAHPFDHSTPSGRIIPGSGNTASPANPVQDRVPVTIDSGAFTIAQAQKGSAVELVGNGQTVTLVPGGPGTMYGSQVVSAVSAGGIAIGTGAAASTIGLRDGFSGAKADLESLAISPGEAGGVQIVQDGNALALTPGGAAATVGSEVISAAASDRVVVGTGSTASTITLSTTQKSTSRVSITRVASTTTTHSLANQATTATEATSTADSGTSRRLLVSTRGLIAALMVGLMFSRWQE